MAAREPTMYAEKHYELEDMKAKLMDVFNNDMGASVRSRHQVFWELGETKTLLLLFDKWYFRLREGSYVTLVILLTEYHGCQGADLIATCGEMGLSSWGVEEDLAAIGVQVLKALGFAAKNL